MEFSESMPSEKLNMKETAEFYRLALGLGLVTVGEAIAWCDAVIAAQDDPPLAILRASMVKGKKHNGVENELALLEGEFDEAAVLRRLFAKMYELLSHDPAQMKRILNALISLGTDNPSLDEETKAEIRHFHIYEDLCDENIFGNNEQQRAFTEKKISKMLNFLQHTSKGEVTGYAQQAVLNRVTPVAALANIGSRKSGLVFEALIVGGLTAIAVLMMRSPEQAGSGIGWGEVCLAIIVIALYFGIKKWRRKR